MSEVVVAQKGPFVVAVKAGEAYWWCACGRSKSQPFCDGSHEGTGLEPVEWIATADRNVPFCGCKHTAKPTMCDGSHKHL